LHEKKEVVLMRRVIVVLGVAAVMAATLALTAGVALAQEAKPDHYRERLPVSEEWTNWCTGETVTWEGTVQMVYTFGESAGGNVLSAGLHLVQLQGTSDSGARYILHQSATSSVVIVGYDPEGGFDSVLTETIRYPVSIIRQGEDGTPDDYRGQILFHLTQNADGEITAQVEIFNPECN
jgi:hypothetical protein